MVWSPSFRCLAGLVGDEPVYQIGHPVVDEFLEFVAGRARPNTVRAYAHDLKVFLEVVGKGPGEVTPGDVLAFVSAQRRRRAGAENVVRIADGAGGLSAATIKRRLAAVSSLYGYLVARGVVAANPVPRGLPTRRSRRELRGVPLVRAARRLPASSTPRRSRPSSRRYAPDATAPWSKPCCSAACGDARFSVFSSGTCAWASGGCSWRRARAATSAWSRCRARSSPPWPST